MGCGSAASTEALHQRKRCINGGAASTEALRQRKRCINELPSLRQAGLQLSLHAARPLERLSSAHSPATPAAHLLPLLLLLRSFPRRKRDGCVQAVQSMEPVMGEPRKSEGLAKNGPLSRKLDSSRSSCTGDSL
jgi:hypothetical protein